MTNAKKLVLEPRTQRFLDRVAAQDGRATETLPVSEARKRLEELQSGAVATADVQAEDRTLPVGPGGEVSVTIYRPAVLPGPVPVTMYFHGGGWVLGSKETHDRLVRGLVQATGAAFVFVNYSLSPEVRHPVQIEEVYAATKYIAEHGGELGLDGSRLAVAGDSVGGTMAAVVPLLAKERGGPSICYQVLCYPVTDSSMTQASYSEYADGPWLTRQRMEWFWNLYAPNPQDRKEMAAVPMFAGDAQLRGLPPALIIVAEHDVLRDEGEEYARRLSLAEVEVTAVRYLSTIHSFMSLNELADTPAAKSALDLVSRNLRAALAT